MAWRDAALSAARAAGAHDLVERGLIATAGLVAAADHLGDLIVHRDERLLIELRRSMLAPLAEESPGSRDRLVETLRVWLDRQGVVSSIAEALFVHPQTVRYRVGRLRELFGERLDDPAFRFELALALRAAEPGEDRR